MDTYCISSAAIVHFYILNRSTARHFLIRNEFGVFQVAWETPKYKLKIHCRKRENAFKKAL
jgi:hypothetical protein